MGNTFNETLWELGVNRPHLQQAIAQTMTAPLQYSIPTRKVSPLTGELEDIHITIMEIEDPDRRERAMELVKEADKATVEELALRLNVLHAAYTIKEVQGEELTEQERTLKDLDITALAYTLLHMDWRKQAFRTFESGEEFIEEYNKLAEKIKKEK